MIGTIVTTRGRMLMAKMVAMEGGISFTRAAVGTGNIPKGHDPSHLIGLNQYKMDGMITGATSSQETASITFQIDSRDVEEGFTITEAGLYADDPDEGEILYAYLDMRDDPQYIYPRIGDVNKVAEITLGVIIGQVDRITAMISPGGLVTKEQMEGALETKLGKGEDSGDSIIAFASDDSADVSGWTAVDTLQNGETHKSFAQKVSTMFKNVRYIWKLIGTSDISGIGDGTLTGAVNELNTGIEVINGKVRLSRLKYISSAIAAQNGELYMQFSVSDTEYYQLTFKTGGLELGYSKNGVWTQVWYIAK